MPAFVETMAYLDGTEKPWHGLGNTIPVDASLDEALKIAGLDWPVELRQLYYRSPCDPGEDGLGAVTEAAEYRVVVRDLDGARFAVVGDGYEPVQNEEIVGLMRESVEAMGLNIDTLGSLKGGRVIWCLAKLPNGHKAADGDPLEGYILLFNSHDGSLRAGGRVVATRVVCWNTLSLALHERAVRQFAARHTRNIHVRLEQGAELLGLARKAMVQYEAEAQELVASPCEIGGRACLEYLYQLTQPDLLKQIVEAEEAAKGHGSLLEAVVSQHDRKLTLDADNLNRVGKAILEQIISSPGADIAGDTWWRVENGVTRWADHVAGRNADNRLQSAWFGERDGLKRQAHDLALQYARAGRS